MIDAFHDPRMSNLGRTLPRIVASINWAARNAVNGRALGDAGLGLLGSSRGVGPVNWQTGALTQLQGWLQRGYADLPAHMELAMPSLSPTMTQGNIAAWRKNEGDSVQPGDILAEVETDKATIEWEAQEEGFIAKILMPAGSKDIPVGQTVALIVEEEGDLAAFKDYKPGAASSKQESAAAKPPAAEAAPAEPAASSSSGGGGGSFPPHEVMKMPALSPTMSAGNIVSWQKKVGDSVAPGDMLCEVETDKATIAWEAQEEGFIAAILLPDGAKEVAVGTPAAVLVEEEDMVPKFANYKAEDATGGAAPKAAKSAPPPPPPAAAAAPKPAEAAAPSPPDRKSVV